MADLVQFLPQCWASRPTRKFAFLRSRAHSLRSPTIRAITKKFLRNVKVNEGQWSFLLRGAGFEVSEITWWACCLTTSTSPKDEFVCTVSGRIFSFRLTLSTFTFRGLLFLQLVDTSRWYLPTTFHFHLLLQPGEIVHRSRARSGEMSSRP